MAFKTTIFSAILGVCVTGSAFAQVETQKTIENVPTLINVDKSVNTVQDPNFIKTQHIRRGDVSDEEYQRLLNEAERIRAYQSYKTYQGSLSGISGGAGGIASTQTRVTAPVQPQAAIQTQSNGQPQRQFMSQTEAWKQLQAQRLRQSQGQVQAQVHTQGQLTQPTYNYGVQSVTQAATSNTAPQTYIHDVKKGDTLYSISRHYNISINSIRSSNNLPGNNIFLGQSLVIPSLQNQVIDTGAGQTDGLQTNSVVAPYTISSSPTLVNNPNSGIYAVLPGDTLFGIARRACVDVQGIRTANGIANPNGLQPGQRLRMPNGHCL